MSLLRQQHIDMLKKLAAALKTKPQKGYTRVGCCISTDFESDAGAEPIVHYVLDAADLAYLLAAVEQMPRSKSEIRRVDSGRAKP